MHTTLPRLHGFGVDPAQLHEAARDRAFGAAVLTRDVSDGGAGVERVAEQGVLLFGPSCAAEPGRDGAGTESEPRKRFAAVKSARTTSGEWKRSCGMSAPVVGSNPFANESTIETT